MRSHAPAGKDGTNIEDLELDVAGAVKRGGHGGRLGHVHGDGAIVVDGDI